MVVKLHLSRKWFADDSFHGDYTRAETSIDRVVVDLDEHYRRVVQHKDCFGGLLLPAHAVGGIKLDVSDHASRIHGCLARAYCNCDADLHLYMQKQHGWKSPHGVHVGYLEEVVSHGCEVPCVYVHDVISR